MNTVYLRPTSVGDALHLLREQESAQPLAGGTDLMLQLRLGSVNPGAVVDVRGIPELRSKSIEDGLIGASVTMRELLESSQVSARFQALAEAARLLGGRQIQSMATLGGNVCNGSPAAETATPLLVHDAHAHVESLDRSRKVPLTDFWLGPSETTLAPGELLTAIQVEEYSRSAYRRIDLRRSVDIALVSVSVAIQVSDMSITRARVAIGAAAPTPYRSEAAEESLVGVSLGSTESELRPAVNEAAFRAAESASPIDDIRASARYRRAMIEVLTRRAVIACITNP